MNSIFLNSVACCSRTLIPLSSWPGNRNGQWSVASLRIFWIEAFQHFPGIAGANGWWAEGPIRFDVSDASTLPWPDGTVDLVVTSPPYDDERESSLACCRLGLGGWTGLLDGAQGQQPRALH